MKSIIIVVMIFINLSNLPLFFSIRVHSSIEKKKGLIIPLYQKSSLHVLDPLSVAPIERYTTRIIYYMKFFVGTPPEEVHAAFDTGSTFSWVQENRTNPSTTYQPVGCDEFLCRAVPNGGCSDFSQICLYSLQYGDHSSSNGEVGTDMFSLYSPNETGHEPNPDAPFEMMYGTPLGYQKLTENLNGVIGAEGLRKALQVNSFSICYPRPSSFTTYLRFGEDAFVFGKTTPIVMSSGHFKFKVNFISNGGLLLNNNLTIGGDPGMYIIFDTGAALSYLHPIAYKSLIDSVKESIYASPVTESIPSGYELCYKASDRTSYRALEIMFHMDGPSGRGFMRFDYYNLWNGDWCNSDQCVCFTFLRSESLQSIFGVQHMQGYNFAIDTDSMMLSYGRSSCKPGVSS